jgi:hypothetical protein
LILMSVGFLPAFSFILVAGAWEAVALRFLVLLIVGLLLEPLAVAAIEPAPGGLLETGIAECDAQTHLRGLESARRSYPVPARCRGSITL